jgi:hypothetical protein
VPKVTSTTEEPTGKAIKLISPAALKSYHESASKFAASISNMVGDLGKLTSEAVSKKYLNSKAYKLCTWANKQEPEKAAEFWAQLDHARECMKCDEHAELQGRLFPVDGAASSRIVKATSKDANGVPRGTDEDGEPDMRPSHMRQPNASAADAVDKIKNDALSQVGRGNPDVSKPH